MACFFVAAGARPVIIIGGLRPISSHVIVTRINSGGFNCPKNDREREKKYSCTSHIYIAWSCLFKEKYLKKSAVEYKVS
jgi:hypothetical protein